MKDKKKITSGIFTIMKRKF